MAGVAWTREEDRRLRAMAETATSTEIGLAIGRTAEAVKHRAKTLSVSLAKHGDAHPWTKYPDTLIEQARQLHDQGWGPVWIAKRLGMNVSALKSALYYHRRRAA